MEREFAFYLAELRNSPPHLTPIIETIADTPLLKGGVLVNLLLIVSFRPTQMFSARDFFLIRSILAVSASMFTSQLL